MLALFPDFPCTLTKGNEGGRKLEESKTEDCLFLWSSEDR